MDDSIDSLWLVYKWEGMKPLNLYYDVGPPQPVPGFLKSKSVGVGAVGWG